MTEVKDTRGTPPNEWFEGIARPGKGLIGVSLNETFEDLLGPEIFHLMQEWRHHMGNQGRELEREEDFPDPEVRGVLIAARDKITTALKFSPREIIAWKAALLESFRGQTATPFRLEEFEDVAIDPYDAVRRGIPYVNRRPLPMSDFHASGNQDTGIEEINLERFWMGLAGEALPDWHKWRSYEVSSDPDAPELAAHFRKRIQVLLSRDPKVMIDQLRELQDKFKGKFEAPFTITLEPSPADIPPDYDGPPLDWFYGIGFQGEPIDSIQPNELKMKEVLGDDGYLSYVRWYRILGIIRKDLPTTKEEDLDEADKAICLAARELISQRSGFTPTQIEDQLIALNTEYKGKKRAPVRLSLSPK